LRPPRQRLTERQSRLANGAGCTGAAIRSTAAMLKSEDMIGDGITAARDGASKVSRKRECRRGGVAT